MKHSEDALEQPRKSFEWSWAKTIMPEICKWSYINIHRTDAWYFIHINVLFHTEISIFSPLFIYAPVSVRFSSGCWHSVTSHKKRKTQKLLIYIKFSSRYKFSAHSAWANVAWANISSVCFEYRCSTGRTAMIINQWTFERSEFIFSLFRSLVSLRIQIS